MKARNKSLTNEIDDQELTIIKNPS
jgi:hypothetical protein